MRGKEHNARPDSTVSPRGNWWKQQLTGFVVSFVVALALVVTLQVGLGWNLERGEISIIVLFVLISGSIIMTVVRRWKGVKRP